MVMCNEIILINVIILMANDNNNNINNMKII